LPIWRIALWVMNGVWNKYMRKLVTGLSAAAVALAWTIRSGNVIAIPESGSQRM
jgi:hypothetical protein